MTIHDGWSATIIGNVRSDSMGTMTQLGSVIINQVAWRTRDTFLPIVFPSSFHPSTITRRASPLTCTRNLKPGGPPLAQLTIAHLARHPPLYIISQGPFHSDISMAEITGTPSSQNLSHNLIRVTFACQDIDTAPVTMLQERYRCPHFRILVIGRANAGKTTILEKVCGVAHGTKPIIYNQNGVKLNAMWRKLHSNLGQLLGRKPASSHLAPSMEVSQMVK